MWNYSFLVPCALMMITLLGFYFSRSRPPLLFNRLFLGLLVTELLVLFTDLISTRIDETYELFSPATLYVANTAFFVVFVLRIFMFFRFTLELLSTCTGKRPKWRTVFSLPFVMAEVLCLTSFATGAIFSVQDGAYASGPLYQSLSVTYFFYEWAAILLTLSYAKLLRKQELVCALAFNLVLFAGTVVRVLMPRLLVMDTVCMVALTIIYLGFLNPDLYLSDNGPTFNTRSLRMVLNELPRLQYKHLLGFSLRNYNHERSILGSRQMDAVIQLVSMYLKQEFPQEVPFYLRGGRFALIGPDPHTEIELSKRILARFQEPWRVGNAYFSMSASFVYVDEASEALDTDRALNDLIIALDNARLNPVPTSDDIVATPLDMQEIDRQVNMLRTLERALKSESVEVFFQPLVNSQTLVIEGAEALARIRDEQGQIVPPGKFIAIAERSGLIIELGEQVLKKTCEFVVSHDLDALGISWININLSPVQCMQQGIDDHFAQILEEYGIDPSVIHLEITEQSMVDYALLQQQISTLEKLGFVFVLDDYGSGYSNLARVKQYPFSTIKLDMGVVWDYYRDKDDLLPSIVRGFKSVGLSITAEGIETKEMAEALTSIGSDYLQGYYFSRPLPVPEFLQFLSPQPR